MRFFNLMRTIWKKNREIRELEEKLEEQEKMFRYTVEFYEDYTEQLEDKLN